MKVLDFGLAKLTEQQLATVDSGDRSGEQDTLPGVVLGTKDLGIASSESGQMIKIIELPRSAYPRKMQWTPDGKSITYIDSRGGADNLWMQSLEGGSPIQLTNFKEYRIHFFAWSRDGKYLVFNRGFQTGDIVLINSVE